MWSWMTFQLDVRGSRAHKMWCHLFLCIQIVESIWWLCAERERKHSRMRLYNFLRLESIPFYFVTLRFALHKIKCLLDLTQCHLDQWDAAAGECCWTVNLVLTHAMCCIVVVQIVIFKWQHCGRWHTGKRWLISPICPMMTEMICIMWNATY